MAVRHDPAGELVDHADASVAHQVVDVAAQQDAGVQGAVDLGQQRVVFGVVQVAHAERVLESGESRLGRLDAPAVLVGVEVDAGRESRNELRNPSGPRLVRLGPSGQDQRHARLVDEQGVGFVHQRHVERPVHDGVGIGRPQVAQVIEACLLGGDVGDVGPIGAAPGLRRHVLLDGVHREAEHAVDGAHPLGVAAGQVVVERQDVDAVAGQRVESRGHDRGQRLALAGLHLDHPAARQGQGRDHLHVERSQAEGAAGRFPHQGEERRPQPVEGQAGFRPPRGARLPAA